MALLYFNNSATKFEQIIWQYLEYNQRCNWRKNPPVAAVPLLAHFCIAWLLLYETKHGLGNATVKQSTLFYSILIYGTIY